MVISPITPFANAYGVDSFTYRLLDGRGGVATGNVGITITPVGDAPAGADKTRNPNATAVDSSLLKLLSLTKD